MGEHVPYNLPLSNPQMKATGWGRGKKIKGRVIIPVPQKSVMGDNSEAYCSLVLPFPPIIPSSESNRATTLDYSLACNLGHSQRECLTAQR